MLEYTGSKLEKIGKGTTRIPAFNIISWIDRPLGMYADSTLVHMPVDVASKALKADEAIAPPAPAKTVMAAAVADDEMF